ncbi:MAG: HDOD domain-containing protein [Gammaproteobacteria bacterium]|nr:HDOD domain-containing protein [Gammaproteobacteria bacterium]MCP5202150.1 HDOD domain-containing protein [Gammaproteobacteria bacterium]
MASTARAERATAGAGAGGGAPHLIESIKGLVSPPDVCARVLQLARSPTASADDIGAVVACDPTLTSRVLRIANSPLYGLRGRVDTVSRAITILGSDALVNLVVAVSAVASFSRIANDLVNMDTFWRHSLYSALIARDLARQCHVLHPERLFVAGLLHDIGSLVIYHRTPDTARALLTAAAGDEGRMFALERDNFGFSHAEVGALLLESWTLPEALQDAVRWHHEPASAPGDQSDPALVHIADALANHSGIGGFCEVAATDTVIDAGAWPALGIAPDALDLEALISEAGVQFAEIASLLVKGR